MQREESTEWVKKGAPVFERLCNTHHAPEPLLESGNVDRLGVRHLSGPSDEPCRSSLGNAGLVRAVEVLEPDLREDMGTLAELQRTKKEMRAAR